MAQKQPTQQSDQPSLEGLHKAFGDMSKALQDLPRQVGVAVTTSLQQLAAAEASKRSAAQPAPTPAPAQVNPVELEKMSRSEFMGHIMSQLGTVLDEKLKPFQDTVTTTAEATSRERIQAKFDAARKQHADFDEWRQEMGALIEKHGYLDPDELYVLARGQNKEKAQEIDNRLAAEQEEAKKAEAEKQNQPAAADRHLRVLSLLPTSSGRSTDEDGQPKKYETARAAAEAAFDEILGNVPDSVIGVPSNI